ncbi:hypothetical protein ASD15_07715 [Massilia sp. Root351]|uniref:DUF4214 domain-containing protein n=1 Tax=Massilia sp. Root351 TaxID=1736522 RepID=UPI00070E6BE2|nr:DUF4214 domain-containing protein [Massilia sp. Root351]KQV85011.1 hypothetical protein ASD15_07715 [Massilia sp. Root351]
MATAEDYTLLAQQLYLANLWRPADYNGLKSLSTYLANANAPTNLTDLQASYNTHSGVRDVLNNFSGSAESAALYGNVTDAVFVTAAYQHLLGRDPLLAGLTFWTDALKNHEVTRATVATQIIAAASKEGANAADKATIANKMLFSTYFTSVIDTPAEIAKYSGAAAAAQVRVLEGAVGATTAESVIKSLVDNYWNPVPTPVAAMAAETHLAVANADGAELIGINQSTVLS